jgi:hypothetical protein
MTLRAAAFGDVGLGNWGAVFSPGPELPSFAVLGGEQPRTLPVSIAGETTPGSEWLVSGEGLELALGPAAGEQAAAVGQDGFDQLVSVRGELPGDGAREVELIGSRGLRSAQLELGGFELVRDVRAWFTPGDGLALSAVRPRRAKAHADERLSATVFEEGEPLAVAEPRISTTYSEDSLPGAEEEGRDEQAEQAAQYPRRAAGEAAGTGITQDLGPLRVHARPFRWRTARRDGSGVYLLAWAR